MKSSNADFLSRISTKEEPDEEDSDKSVQTTLKAKQS